jgi:glycosyltransferase involved in cell wall biosynthesis
MRIFCFGSDYPPTGGGIATHTREWLRALASEKSIKVRATIFGNKVPREEKVGGLIEITTVRSVNFFYVGWRIFQDMWKFRHYEIFHAFNLFPVGFWTVFWSKIFGKKCVLTFYGADACDKRTSAKVLWLQKWTIKHATWALTISEFTKQKVIERYVISDKNIHIIHPILPHFEKGDEYIKNDNNFVILSVSRLVKRKGIEYLIEAVSKIPDPKVQLMIVGGGPEQENLKKVAERLKVNDRVTFTGRVSSLTPYYQKADVVALVSYIVEEEGDFEGLGLVLLEAQSHGKPVIGTESGGIPETFENERTGILVPERDAEAIRRAIVKLRNHKMEDPHEFLEREFGREATVGRYLQLISK